MIKLFVLDYKIGKHNIMRAPVVIMPLILITGLVLAYSPNYPIIDWYEYILLGLLAISVWFGFFHWKFFPVRWAELDDYQKWVYGIAVGSGQLTKPTSSYDVNWKEWKILDIKYKN